MVVLGVGCLGYTGVLVYLGGCCDLEAVELVVEELAVLQL